MDLRQWPEATNEDIQLACQINNALFAPPDSLLQLISSLHELYCFSIVHCYFWIQRPGEEKIHNAGRDPLRVYVLCPFEKLKFTSFPRKQQFGLQRRCYSM